MNGCKNPLCMRGAEWTVNEVVSLSSKRGNHQWHPKAGCPENIPVLLGHAIPQTHLHTLLIWLFVLWTLLRDIDYVYMDPLNAIIYLM